MPSPECRCPVSRSRSSWGRLENILLVGVEVVKRNCTFVHGTGSRTEIKVLDVGLLQVREGVALQRASVELSGRRFLVVPAHEFLRQFVLHQMFAGQNLRVGHHDLGAHVSVSGIVRSGHRMLRHFLSKLFRQIGFDYLFVL